MKFLNHNILGPFFSGNPHEHCKDKSLSLTMVLTMILLGVNYLGYAASSNALDHGIEAFKQGDFTRARSVLSQYVDGQPNTTQVQVYLFAMEETPTTTLSNNMIQDIIHKSATGDNIFKIMEARLHLLGLHPHANTQEGLKILESLAHTQGYAAYTLGLYFEGTLDGIKRDQSKAKSWYETAKHNHYVQAMVKLYALDHDRKSGPPQTTLGDPLPDLHQRPIQNQHPTYPLNPIEQSTRESLTTSYPLLGNASHWGGFLYQRKMDKLSQKNIPPEVSASPNPSA
jgi:TPR repeat protein